MDLVDRYLQAVKFWLPVAQAEDIVAELREDILSEVDERESKLGRKLNEKEIEALLKQRGRPLLAANRYLPQKDLIGRALLPAYWFVLRLVMLCYLGPWIAVWIALMIFSPSYRVQHSGAGTVADLYVFLANATLVFAVVTIIFAVTERVKDKAGFASDWSPGKLPPVRKVDGIPRSSSAFELIAGVIFGAWWLKILWTLHVLSAGSFQITLDAAWHKFFWVFLPLTIVNATLSAANFVRPYWTKVRRGVRAGTNLIAAMAFAAIATNLPPFYASGNVTSRGAAVVVGSVIVTLIVSFALGALICLILALADLWRLIRSSRNGLPLKPRTAM